MHKNQYCAPGGHFSIFGKLPKNLHNVDEAFHDELERIDQRFKAQEAEEKPAAAEAERRFCGRRLFVTTLNVEEPPKRLTCTPDALRVASSGALIPPAVET